MARNRIRLAAWPDEAYIKTAEDPDVADLHKLLVGSSTYTDHVYQALSTDGTATGAHDVTGDYSLAEEDFYIQPPAGQVYRIERMLVHVVDSGTFDSGSYGNGIVLTNGITVIKEINTVENDLTAGIPVKKNPDWGMHCFDTAPSNYGIGNEALAIRWTFSKAGAPIRLNGDTNDKIIVRVNDDFTGLVEHHFLVQGIIE